MALNPGQKLGPYEIIEAAGAGGMGEVYKAKDNRLDRIVAIKVLPSSMAMNADIKARFEREAKSISSMNHPNICTLYDIGNEDGVDFLVMEFLEGETLSERIKKGSIPLKEALEFATQIADALDKAHKKGMVHRDLKPANVMITKQGAKLLDFGLAKIQMSGGVVDGVNEITQTTPLTGTGTIIGTIQYMAPEQLDGTEADSRSDIFAFGAVLYQMITGRRPFEGKSQASLIAAIIERTPATISSISPMTPPALDRLVSKCLEKDPEDRWQSARDLADELRWIGQSGSQAGIPKPLAAQRKFRFRLGWSVSAVAIFVAGFYAFIWHTQPDPVKKVIRFGVGVDNSLASIWWPQISPDGKQLLLRGRDSTVTPQVLLRSMDSRELRMLPGTQEALRPVWSPDSRFIVYTTGGKLKKVPIGGGPAQLIGEFERAADCSWGSQGTILFDGSTTDTIRMVSAAGGTAVGVTSLDTTKGDRYHAWPEFLPDGRYFLYLASSDTILAAQRYMLRVGDTESDLSKDLFEVTTHVKYCEPGYLVYVSDKILLARAFDISNLEVTGEPIPVVEDVSVNTGSAIAHYSVSNEGTLVYKKADGSSTNELLWLDRKGLEIGKIGEPGRYGDVAISPDGQQLVYGLDNPRLETADLWTYDLSRDIATRFTFSDENELAPVWTPDGERIYYTRGTFPRVTPGYRLVDGSGDFIPLMDSIPYLVVVTDISSDNSQAIVTTISSSSTDIEVLELDGNDKLTPIVRTPQSELLGVLSPDRKLMAYVVDQSGASDIFIRRHGGGAGKWQISFDGFRAFKWSRSGKTLYYFNQEWEFKAVPISTTGNQVAIGTPEYLFTHRISAINNIAITLFDVSPDEQKFIVVSQMPNAPDPEFEVVLNWTETLDQY